MGGFDVWLCSNLCIQAAVALRLFGAQVIVDLRTPKSPPLVWHRWSRTPSLARPSPLKLAKITGPSSSETCTATHDQLRHVGRQVDQCKGAGHAWKTVTLTGYGDNMSINHSPPAPLSTQNISWPAHASPHQQPNYVGTGN